MKIKKYSIGGSTYIPVFEPTTTAPTQGAVASGNDDWLEKKIADIIMENGGLESDTTAFLRQAKNILSFGFGNSQSTLAELIRIKGLATRVKFNNDMHAKAVDNINSENAGSDAAVTADGHIWVISESGLDKIRPDEYVENQESYRILSNSDLMNLREQNPSLAYRSDILQDLRTTVGMKTIMSSINTAINNFGQISRTVPTQMATEISNGLQKLQNISGSVTNTYQIYSTFDSEAKNEIAAAARYIFNSLSAVEQNVLNARAKLQGQSAGEFIIESIAYNTDRTFKIDFDKNGRSGSGSGSGNGGDTEIPREAAIATGMWGDITNYSFRGTTDKARMNVKGMDVGLFFNDQGKVASAGILSDILNEDQLSQILDSTQISFGDQFIGDKSDRIFWNKDHIYRMVLPIDQDKARFGIIVPNIELVSKANEFYDWLKTSPNATPAEKKAKLKELVLDDVITYDVKTDTMEGIPGLSHTFIVTNGITADDVVMDPEINWDSAWLNEVEEPSGFERYYEYGNDPTTKTNHYRTLPRDWWWNRKWYKSAVFIPIKGASSASIDSVRIPKDWLHGDLQSGNVITQMR